MEDAAAAGGAGAEDPPVDAGAAAMALGNAGAVHSPMNSGTAMLK